MKDKKDTQERGMIITENGSRIYLSPATVRFIKNNHLTIEEFRKASKNRMSMTSPVEKNKRRLKAIILKKSYLKGKIFTLTSGKKSDFYVDMKVTALDDEGSFLLGTAFARMITREFPEAVAVAGMTLGGDPLVTATSLCAYLDPECQKLKALIIRKEAKGHGTGQFIEGMENVPEGSSVVVIDDTSTIGGSLIKSVERVIDAGYKVVGVITSVERQEGAVERLKKETGFDLKWLFTREELLA